MMTARQKRAALVGSALGGLAVATTLVLSAVNKNLVFFLSPSQVVTGNAPIGRTFRLGGVVEEGSLRRDGDGLTARFVVTDTVNRIPVAYAGPLPDLFKEGHGCVAQGMMAPDGTFIAEQVLAKHDENYMPVEAAAAIEHAGK
jgi:cytochrome c-type biogenesis protein CcmE